MCNKLLLLVLTVACYYQLVTSFSMDQFKRIRRVMGAAKVLQYGDNCSWEVEEARQNFTRLFFNGNIDAVMKITNDFEERGDKLCSDWDLYVCDRESGKCVCGDSGYETLLGVNRPIFTLEGNDGCRWDAETYCFPEDFRKWPTLPGSSSPHSMCKSGTTCRVKDGELCTRKTILQYFGNMSHLETRMVMQEWISNKVCSCVVNAVEH